MTFTQAALVVVAVAALVLGLVCYHLLSRLDLLERAIQGGMEPPSRRLGREEYEQRFRRAVARARLGEQIDSGVVIVLGAEAADGAHEVAAALANLNRGDGVTAIAAAPAAEAFLENLPLPGLARHDFSDDLGVGVTPFAFVIDGGNVTAARAIVSADDLIELVTRHT